MEIYLNFHPLNLGLLKQALDGFMITFHSTAKVALNGYFEQSNLAVFR